MPNSPYKLTEQVTAHLVEAVQVGAFLHDAADYAGISRETLRQWLDQGKAAADAGEDSPQAALWGTLQQTQAATKIAVMKHWYGKSTRGKGFLAARDWLARRWPEEWGPREHQTITHDGNVTTTTVAVVATTSLPDLYRLLAGAGGLQPGIIDGESGLLPSDRE